MGYINAVHCSKFAQVKCLTIFNACMVAFAVGKGSHLPFKFIHSFFFHSMYVVCKARSK